MSTLVTEFRPAKHSKKLVGKMVIITNKRTGETRQGRYLGCVNRSFGFKELDHGFYSSYPTVDWEVTRLVERIER